MIVVKAIKPSRLREDAMRLELLNAMRRVGTGIKKDFEATTKTWKHKVKFEQLISLLLVNLNGHQDFAVFKGVSRYVQQRDISSVVILVEPCLLSQTGS